MCLVIGEELLLQFIECLTTDPGSDDKGNMIRLDFSNRWFTLMHSTRPFTIRDFQELADHVRDLVVTYLVHWKGCPNIRHGYLLEMQAAASLETVRDITVASKLIGDMTGATLDDPLSDRYQKLGCSVSPLDKESEDYKMILKYLEKTYEPVKLGGVVSSLRFSPWFYLCY